MGYEVGTKVELMEHWYQNKHYAMYEIKQVIKHAGFNMYICENIKTNRRQTFTDKDNIENKGSYIKVKG